MDKHSKIVGYWAMAMLNYRQPKGDEALAKLREITDADTSSAIMYISGFSTGIGFTIRIPPLFRLLRKWQIRKSTRQLEKLAKPVEGDFS